MTTLDLTADIIDIRDIIARFEELDSVFVSSVRGAIPELENLRVILERLQGTGGDEQWRGDWYPVTLIRDSYFKTYAQDLAEWPHSCIDWDKAVRELQYDYFSLDINGATYWTR